MRLSFLCATLIANNDHYIELSRRDECDDAHVPRYWFTRPSSDARSEPPFVQQSSPPATTFDRQSSAEHHLGCHHLNASPKIGGHFRLICSQQGWQSLLIPFSVQLSSIYYMCQTEPTTKNHKSTYVHDIYTRARAHNVRLFMYI
jgi:hypothetical protein